MKIVFLSNYLNHHQLPISEEFIRLGNEFYFITTEEVSKNRLELGYIDLNNTFKWVIKSDLNYKEYQRALNLINTADVVISGGMYKKMLKKRIKSNKITFIYIERPMKKGNTGFQGLKTIIHLNFLYRFCQNKKVYILCSSAYTSADLLKSNLFKNKCYKWGYFPKIQKENIDYLIKTKRLNKKVQILWVARFLNWKHPEYVIYLADQLIKKGYDFDINMIGIGPYEDLIKTKIKELKLDKNIHVLGAKSQEAVRDYMKKANIFLCTSDFEEGWGAVINEAMNSACAVVASHAVGSVPFLIKDGKNGLIYTYGNKNQFVSKVENLILNLELRESISKEAYYSVINEWNPENAVKKFLLLCKNHDDKNFIEGNGICSKAEIYENYWKIKQ